MKLEQQVTSLELSKKLKELGLKQESLYIWREIMENYKWTRKYKLESLNEHYDTSSRTEYPAYTVAELGEMFNAKDIGDFRSSFLGAGGWFCKCGWSNNSAKKQGLKITENHFIDKTEANARAKTLVYLIENNLLKT